jgi:alanyl-tRNA synthetase
VLALIQGKDLVEEAREGSSVQVITDRTPFYGEAGGQVGDTGRIGSEKFQGEVEDTQRSLGLFLHQVAVKGGRIRVGEEVRLSVEEARRVATQRNHTATHLLHRALHDVLGNHAEQAGSLVAPDRLRFDFSHPKAMSPEEVREVERRMNEKILSDLPVTTREMAFEAARREGAMALFGEKYGDRVRVVDVEGYSKELCGGTHVARTGEIGAAFILQETSVASGVRRVEAVTGTGVLDRLRDVEALVADVGDRLRAPRELLARRIEEILEENRKLRSSIEQAQKARVFGQAQEFEPVHVSGVRLFVHRTPPLGAEALRSLADRLRTRRDGGTEAPPTGVLLLSPAEDRVALLAAMSKELVERGISAADLLREATRVLGGRGGGRPDLAQGQGIDASKIDEAARAALSWLEQRLAG